MAKRKSLTPLPQRVADALTRALASIPAHDASDDPLMLLRQRAVQAAKPVYKAGHGPRRFPAPWSYVDAGQDMSGSMTGSFVVSDANEWPVAYVYYDDEPTRRTTAKWVTRDEARRIAANIAKLPELIAMEKQSRGR
jgi:hypothetical protein